MKGIVRTAQLKQLDFNFDKNNQKMVLHVVSNEGLSIVSENFLSILSFKCMNDNSDDDYIHNGYNSDEITLNRKQSSFPVDNTCGSQLVLLNIDVIENQKILTWDPQL